jgi:hypothetical protein
MSKDTAIGLGIFLAQIAKSARANESALQQKPIRRHRNWFVDAWLGAKSASSGREFWFGPLPHLLEMLGRGLAWFVIIARSWSPVTT